MKKHFFSTILLAFSIVALSASAVLAAQPSGASGFGEQISAVAKAVTALSDQSHGEAVSALAKTHGAAISALAKAKGAAASAAGKTKGPAAATAGKAKGAAASEPGRIKAAAASAAGGANQP